jgi:hypothetical protein
LGRAASLKKESKNLDQDDAPTRLREPLNQPDTPHGDGAPPRRQSKGASLAGDLLYGTDAIAAFLYGDGAQRRGVYHHAANGGILHFKIGKMICARTRFCLDGSPGKNRRDQPPK